MSIMNLQLEGEPDGEADARGRRRHRAALATDEEFPRELEKDLLVAFDDDDEAAVGDQTLDSDGSLSTPRGWAVTCSTCRSARAARRRRRPRPGEFGASPRPAASPFGADLGGVPARRARRSPRR